MSVEKLKEYTKRAKQLELAIYMQKEFKNQYKEHLNSQYPTAPSRKQVKSVPNKPSKYEPIDENSAYIKPGIVLVLSIILNMMIYSNGGWRTPIIPLIMLGVIIYLYVRAYNKSKELELSNCENITYNKQQWREYTLLLEECKDEQAKYDMEYEQDYEKYKMSIEEHKEEIERLISPHRELLCSLQDTLDKYYEKNVIFPKYRNLVAITMINEYLESGRCYELEGPDGAYNIYENELRQNLIISNLDKIRDNQYTLYQELTNSNKYVKEIIYELKTLNDTSKLNAYFNAVTAIAEVSPKVYHGVQF